MILHTHNRARPRKVIDPDLQHPTAYQGGTRTLAAFNLNRTEDDRGSIRVENISIPTEKNHLFKIVSNRFVKPAKESKAWMDLFLQKPVAETTFESFGDEICRWGTFYLDDMSLRALADALRIAVKKMDAEKTDVRA